jgi:hypothetical protein
MSKAELIPAKTETKVVVIQPEEIVMHLSREEATALRNLTGRIGGPPGNPLRRLTDRIHESLRDLIPLTESNKFDKEFVMNKDLLYVK